MKTRPQHSASAPIRQTDAHTDTGLNAYEIWRKRVLTPRIAELEQRTAWNRARATGPALAGKHRT